MFNLIPLYMYLGHQPMARPQYLYDYVLSQQGIIKRVENSCVSVDYLLAPITEELIGLHLAIYTLLPLRLKVPRIPGRLLAEVVEDARRQLHQESMYHFRFTPAQGWYVTQPRQARSGVWVGYSDDDPTGIVLDLHSHNTMSAFFSAQDDADERGGHFYAVIGRLDRPDPELALRLGAYGHWLYNIPGLALFDDLGPLVETPITAGPEFTNDACPSPDSGGSFKTLFSWRQK